MPYRERLIDVTGILASAEKQLIYEAQVPIAYVPTELICQFFDDSFHPKSLAFGDDFSEVELKDICIFSGYLQIAADEVYANGSPPVTSVLKLPRWREMMKFAQKIKSALEQQRGYKTLK